MPQQSFLTCCIFTHFTYLRTLHVLVPLTGWKWDMHLWTLLLSSALNAMSAAEVNDIRWLSAVSAMLATILRACLSSWCSTLMVLRLLLGPFSVALLSYIMALVATMSLLLVTDVWYVLSPPPDTVRGTLLFSRLGG